MNGRIVLIAATYRACLNNSAVFLIVWAQLNFRTLGDSFAKVRCQCIMTDIAAA
jgi:hypothetical protein